MAMHYETEEYNRRHDELKALQGELWTATEDLFAGLPVLHELAARWLELAKKAETLHDELDRDAKALGVEAPKYDMRLKHYNLSWAGMKITDEAGLVSSFFGQFLTWAVRDNGPHDPEAMAYCAGRLPPDKPDRVEYEGGKMARLILRTGRVVEMQKK